MVAYTTTYNLKKPTVADDEDVWGGYLNDSMDLIDDVLNGTTPVTGIDINSGTVDNVVIGGTTAVAGTFTVLTADTSLGVTGNITVSGTVDGRDVAADGTKLDGIEAGATADQTKADIDALGIAASTASTLATARNIAVTGAVTGNANFDGSGNISIATTATADPTLTLNGDASGSATFTNLGNATLTVTVADDSHNHVISNVDGLQTALNAKYDASNPSGYTTYTANQSLNTSNSPSFAGVNINGNLNAVDHIYLAGTLFHEGDTNTYLTFTTDTITLATGGSSEITVNTTGVRLGDSGNGYFQPVSGNYGSVQIDGGAHGAYEGYSIGGRAVFMHDNSSTTGLYNDVENEWLFRAVHNGSTFLYNNGAAKVEIGATYMEMSQHLDMNNNDIYGVDQIFHHGDTNTYLGFDNDNIALVTGGSGRLTANNSGVFIESALHEDYDAVSGTSPTVDPNNGGAFSLTMSGNTTFTFGGTTSGYGVGFVLQLTGNGSTVTWPASVDWAGGTAPDAPASGETDIYVFWTRDGGTTWYGVQSIDAAA